MSEELEKSFALLYAQKAKFKKGDLAFDIHYRNSEAEYHIKPYVVTLVEARHSSDGKLSFHYKLKYLTNPTKVTTAPEHCLYTLSEINAKICEGFPLLKLDSVKKV